MPIKENAKKAMRQAVKRTRQNLLVRSEIHSLRVKLRKLLTAKNVEAAKTEARVLMQKVDKAAGKGILKKNTAARIKSRLMARINQAAKPEAAK